MKAVTVVVRTDPDDELPAILERLPSNAPCVLVLPPHSRALNGLVGAKLLNRRAEALASRVVVVTADRAVMAHLHAAGVPSAQTVEEAQRILAVDTPDAAAAPDDPDAQEDRAEQDDLHSTPTISLGSAVFTAGAPANGRQDAPAAPDDEPDPALPSGDVDVDATPIRGHSGGRRGARSSAAPSTPTPPFTATGHAPTSRQQSGRRAGGVLLTAGIAIVVLLLLLWLLSYLVGGILNPSATLTLHPRAQAVTASTVVQAVMGLPPAKRNDYRIAMTGIEQPERHMIQLPVRGTKTLPGHVAGGVVRLRNLTTKPLVVPAGTTFTTALNRMSFVSTAGVTLPAAVETFTSTVYGVGTVPIRATVGGTKGNVPARAIINVPAGFAGALGVLNDAPTSGGTDRHVRVVAPRDLASASTRLFGALDQQARQDIARRRGSDVVVHTLFVARSPVVPQVAADGHTATLVLSIVMHARYVHGRDLLPAARAAAQQALSGAAAGTKLVPSSITWVPTWRPDDTIALAVKGRATPPLNVADVLRAIKGRSKAEAAAYLKRRSDVVFKPGDLSVSPLWADHLPDDATRIDVAVGDAR